MPQILWKMYFMRNQGFNFGPKRILQDNKSTMLLEENMMASSSKQTRDLKIWFYFVTDQVHLNNETIEQCPTKSMVADFFTKTLQGSDFYKFRKSIMGLLYEMNKQQIHITRVCWHKLKCDRNYTRSTD
jgi:hypothetical protein